MFIPTSGSAQIHPSSKNPFQLTSNPDFSYSYALEIEFLPTYWIFFPVNKRPLKNTQFCSRSRKARILTTGIPLVFRGSEFDSDAEIGQKRAFFKGLNYRHK
jgi:hypothetical protein